MFNLKIHQKIQKWRIIIIFGDEISLALFPHNLCDISRFTKKKWEPKLGSPSGLKGTHMAEFFLSLLKLTKKDNLLY